MNNIHLHTDDIGDLTGKFIDKYGNGILLNSRLFGYIMQGTNIIKMCYSRDQALGYLNNHKGQIIEPIYFYCE